MAFATIQVSNGVEIKDVPLGFSWTTFFFGFFPALIRQDWLMFAIILILGMLTWGLSGIAFAFMYNRIYLKSLLSKGYKVSAIPATTTLLAVQTYAGLVSLPVQE